MKNSSAIIEYAEEKANESLKDLFEIIDDTFTKAAAVFEPIDSNAFSVSKCRYGADDKFGLIVKITVDIEDWACMTGLSKKLPTVMEFLLAEFVKESPHLIKVEVKYNNLPTEYDEDGVPYGKFGCSCC